MEHTGAPPLLVMGGFALGGLVMIGVKWVTLRIEERLGPAPPDAQARRRLAAREDCVTLGKLAGREGGFMRQAWMLLRELAPVVNAAAAAVTVGARPR